MSCQSKYMLPATSARDQFIITFSLQLIGWQSGATFCSQWQRGVKKNQCKSVLLSTLNWKLLYCRRILYFIRFCECHADIWLSHWFKKHDINLNAYVLETSINTSTGEGNYFILTFILLCFLTFRLLLCWFPALSYAVCHVVKTGPA